MSEHPHPRRSAYALDLDAPAIQGAVYDYLAVLAETLRRVVTAIDAGEHGRAQALEELGMLSVLIHYLRRRLSELAPAEPAPESDGGAT